MVLQFWLTTVSLQHAVILRRLHSVVSRQAAAVPALPVHQHHLPAGQPDLCSAGEDDEGRHRDCSAGARGHQRHTVRPLRRLALTVSLQDRQDVFGQHLPGVQGNEPQIHKDQLKQTKAWVTPSSKVKDNISILQYIQKKTGVSVFFC